MSPQEAYRAMNEDEQFRNLPYEDQLRLRYTWFSKYGGSIPELQDMSPQQREANIRAIVQAPPSFSKPLDDFGSHIVEVGRGVHQGNEAAILEGSDILATTQFANTSGIVGRMAMRLNAAITEGKVERLGVNPNPDAQVRWRPSEQDVEQSERNVGILDAHKDPDSQKAMEYLNSTMAGANLPAGARIQQLGAAVIGLGINIAAGRVTFGIGSGLVSAASGAGFAYRGVAATTRAALTAQRMKTGGRMAKWLFSSAIPELAESAVDGVVLTGAEMLSGTLGQNNPKWLPKAESRIGKMALSFGYNVAADMFVFTTLNLLGSFVRQGVRIARFKRGMSGTEHQLENIRQAVKHGGYSDEDFSLLLGHIVGGDDLPKELFNSLPKQTRRDVRRLSRQWRAIDQLDRLTENDKLELLLGSKGYEVRATEHGYTLLKDGVKVGENYGSFDSVLKAAYKDANVPGQTTMSRVDEAVVGNEMTVQKVKEIKLKPGKKVLSDVLSEGDVAKAGRDFLPNRFNEVVDDLGRRLGMNVSREGDVVIIDGVRYTTAKDAAEALSMKYLFDAANSGDAGKITHLTKQYSKQFGIELWQSELGEGGIERWSARMGEDLIASNKGLGELVSELGNRGFVPKFTQDVAPNMILDEEAGNLIVRQGEVRGPAKFLDQITDSFFDDTDDVNLVQRIGGNKVIERDPIRTVYRVTDGEWGVIDEFPTFGEAKKFIQKKVQSIEDLKDRAFRKGFLELEATGGQIYLRDVEGTSFVARNLEEARNIVKSKRPSKMWRKEISNLNEHTIDSAIDGLPTELKKHLTQSSWKKRRQVLGDMENYLAEKSSWYNEVRASTLSGREARRYGIRLGLQKVFGNVGQQWWDAKYSTVNRLAGETGMDFIKNTFEYMEKQIKNNRGLMYRMGLLIEASQGVKGVSKERRKLLREFLEANPSRWDDMSKNLPGGLSAADRTYLDRTQSVLRNMGDMFGIDAWKMWNEYLPHIRKMMVDNPELFKTGTAMDVMNRIFPKKLPKEAQFFAEHLRNQDIVRWLNEADPAEMLMHYASSGVKNITLGRAFNEVVQRMDPSTMNDNVMWTMTHYLQDVMGMYADEASQIGMRSAADIADTFAKILRKNGEEISSEVMRDTVSKLHSFTISATMAFRPWLPIRNMQQIWTTLAGHYGNSAIMRALKKMNNPEIVGKRAEHLRETGRLMSSNPMFELSGLVFEGGEKGLSSLVRRFAKFGMVPYKNSDDYTRLVVDFVVEDAFGEAAAKLEANRISYKKFLNESGLDRLDVADQRQIVKLLKTKGYKSALDYYGDTVTRETMFAYTSGSNPAAFRGFFGRLFGMFGHYPVYYAQNLRNGLRRGTKIQRLQFAARVAFNSAALWFTFDKVLGIKADAFLPYKTMFHDGGPYFKLISRAFSAMKGGPGAPSRGQVIKEAGRIMVPGSLAFRGWMDGFTALQEGDPYTAILRFMSFPTSD